jgi:hypothetical protein
VLPTEFAGRSSKGPAIFSLLLEEISRRDAAICKRRLNTTAEIQVEAARRDCCMGTSRNFSIMNSSNSHSARLKMILSKSAEFHATTEAKLNCLCEAYQEIAAKGLAAIEAVENHRERARLAEDFAAALDRRLAIMEEFTCSGGHEPLDKFCPPPFRDHGTP